MKMLPTLQSEVQILKSWHLFNCKNHKKNISWCKNKSLFFYLKFLNFKISFDQINQSDLESHFNVCLVFRFLSEELWQIAAVQATHDMFPAAVGEWQNDRVFDFADWIVVIEVRRFFQKVEMFKILDLFLVDAGNEIVFENEVLASLNFQVVDEGFKLGQCQLFRSYRILAVSHQLVDQWGSSVKHLEDRVKFAAVKGWNELWSIEVLLMKSFI